ncbi:hypothetical protein NCS57_01474800 [Fusarium keratoplasticum]|uniref:Uncharacterized protein n=1 Tax=Fusarium keratoplasticum TaxID=1328300 RepID=A0ACC0QC47_9HYPO|nr:hypothetical protein NCS57_01474800 [Fusarium keratoplasticum]KAI8648632.1 hypothetical protein NCS57_01474800 [Fusarium keratoplasticum]
MVSYSIQKVPASTPAADLAAILRKDGALVVQRLVEPAILDTIHQELAPKTIGPLVALAAKSKTFATELLTNSVAQEVASLILTRSTGSCWGPEKSVSTSIHRLSAATLFLHGPGYEGDDLMREDEAHHVRHPASPVEADLGIVFAGTALRAGAGARKVILLSNHWDDEKVPRSELAEDVELDAGDALFFMGSTYTAPGPNTSTDKYLFSIEVDFCGGWCRSRENQYLAVPREIIEIYPEKRQRLLGWYISSPYGGYVEMMDPLEWLKTGGDPAKFRPGDLV